MHRFGLAIVLLFSVLPLWGQGLSPAARISLLTCAPGEELYSAFGHSAIRVYDPVIGLDEVYNYGTFDFSTPNFYLKFMRGKLDYMIDKDPFRQFERVYHYLNRSYQEQVLDLRPEEVAAVHQLLVTNYRPENRYYLYDFFFDNCAARIRDVFEAVLGEDLSWGEPARQGASFRDYLHEYLVEKAWVQFGIDLLIGAVTDRTASVREQMFLPDYLAEAFQGAAVQRPSGSQPFVENRQVLFQAEDTIDPTPWYLHPLFVSLVVMALMLLYSWRQWQGKQGFVVDSIWWSLLGLVGVIIFLLWFATDHNATANNWNLAWALPTHLIAGLLLLKSKNLAWLRWYFLGAGLISAGFLALGPLLPQYFPLALYPVFLVTALRGWALYREGGRR